MDIEKAIDILKRLRIATATSNVDGFRVLEPLSMAISALEKQIPEKPYYLNYGGYNVGNWNHGIACICDYKAPYCRHCGQKLDWSEVEDE